MAETDNPDESTSAASDQPPRESHDPYATLRVPAYRRYLVGNVSAAIGAEMRDLAIAWELYERTDSPLLLGLVGLVQVLPVFVLAVPAGHFADNLSRSRMLVAAESVLATASLSLAILSFSQGPIALYYLILFVVGIANAVSRPARWALVAQLVPNAIVGNAVTWNSTGWQVAAILGPMLTGRILDVSRMAGWVYLIDAGCALLAILSFWPLRTPPARVDREPLSFATMLAGFAYVRRTKLILATITLDLFAVLLGGAVALLPVFARDILQLGPRGLGWLRAATPMGAVLMSLALSHRRPMRNAGRSLLWSVAGFGVATIVFGFSTNAYLSFAMLFLTGAFDNISVVIRATLVQVLTPNAMRGRVSAVNGIFIGASNELGGFESGVAAAVFGPVASVVAGGVGTLFVILGVLKLWPEIRRLGLLAELRPDEASPAASESL